MTAPPCTECCRSQVAVHHLDITLSWSWKTFANPATVYDLSLHPNLKTLAISDYSEYHLENSDPNPMTPFITRLTAPALECFSLDLHLSMYRNVYWATLDEFSSPGQISSPADRPVPKQDGPDIFARSTAYVPGLESSADRAALIESDTCAYLRSNFSVVDLSNFYDLLLQNSGNPPFLTAVHAGRLRPEQDNLIHNQAHRARALECLTVDLPTTTP
ncbi:hypothetical protein MVEN_00237600 [Mycena venus]|uniref:Uncharacterized protein n=1 Tax=Mycena venus TaxID=2733690 RepID=A0A8H6Z196_9AGAR|nr:hypothetical protein MVEN_00237600 [Mycena venus]